MTLPPGKGRDFLHQLCVSRWIVALAGFFLMISSGGSLNNFSLFSQHLKLSLEYNQKDMNTISFFKDMGTSVGILSGLVYDLTGPYVVLLLGFALNFGGYFMIWLATTQRIAHPHVWEICIYLFIIGASAAFTTTAVFVACAKNFPKNQGMILSLLDSTQGLSVAIFALLFQALFSSSSGGEDDFILLLAWFPSLLCLLFMFVIRSVPLEEFGSKYRDTRVLVIFLVATLGLAGYLMAVIILQNFVHLTSQVMKAFFSIMLLILSVPIVVVIREEVSSSSRPYYPQSNFHTLEPNARDPESRSGTRHPQPVADDPETTDIHDLQSRQSSSRHEQSSPHAQLLPVAPDYSVASRWSSKAPKRGDDFTILQALLSMDMLLIFAASTCGVGVVLTVTNNLGQIGTALGYSQSRTNTFIALLSIWDFVGGVGVGYASDAALARRGIARPFFLCAILLLLALGNLIMALGVLGALFYGSVLIGLSIGGQWAVLYTMIAELFGLKFYGTLQNVTYVAKALGTYVLSVRVAGVLYDRESRKGASGSSSDGDELLCYGTHCYRTTFFVMAGACLFAAMVSLILSFRTAKFYSVIVRKRLSS